MKNKFKVFIKKIKNWLSSLSKWAQKNKLKLFTCFCLTFLLFGNLETCLKNKKTASATSIISPSAFIVTPNIATTFGGYGNGSIMPFFISQGSSTDKLMFTAFSSSTGQDLGIRDFESLSNEYIAFTPLYSYGNDRYTHAIGQGSFTAITWNYGRGISSINDILAFAYKWSCYTLGDGSILCYDLHNDKGDTLLGLTISVMSDGFPSFEYIDRYDFLSLSSSLNAQELLTSYYNSGYSSGYNDGYNSGYSSGYNDGINVDFDVNNPFYILKTGVDSLLDIEIFGEVSIGVILKIMFGVALVSIMLKLFMGG